MIYVVCIVFLSMNLFIERFFSSKILAFLSGMWMVIIGYSIILLPIVNLLYFILKKRGARVLGGAVIAFFIFVFAYGSYLAWNPVVRTYEMTVNKASNIDKLNILMVSDLHIGKMIGATHIGKLLDITKERKPDIVMIPGDIIDDNIETFMAENVGDVIAQIKAPLGIFATSGNHDYYGGDLERLFTEMEKAGVTMLADKAVEIEESFYIVGRNDDTDDQRKNIADVVKRLDEKKPVIMMDHQPTEIIEASENGVDVLLSGHTHRGQVAPANLITKWLYENDYGYLKINNLHSIVSSGYGFWGPPFRIGSQSEVVEIIIRFEE